MKFKNLITGHHFRVLPAAEGAPRTAFMKVENPHTHLNAVYLDWRLGCLEFIEDETPVELITDRRPHYM